MTLFQEPSRTLERIRLVVQTVEQDIFLLEQLRILHQADDLAEESDGLLIKLLRVSDVGRDYFVEREALFRV